jgi:hypothetical protein
VILGLHAADDHLAFLGRPEMAADAEQVDVARAGLGIVVPEIAQPRRVARIGQEASARGLGDVGDAVVLRERVLPVPAAARDVEHLRAVQDPLFFRQRGGQDLSRQRTDDEAFEAELAVDLAEPLPRLGHRTLVEDFAGDEEAGALALQRLAGPGDHHDPAVDARIHVLAPPVDGVLDHVDVVLAEVGHPHREAQVTPHLHERLDVLAAGAGRHGIAAEVGDEADARHRDSLFENDPDGEHAVQSAGKESDGFSVHVVQEISGMDRPEYKNRRG